MRQRVEREDTTDVCIKCARTSSDGVNRFVLYEDDDRAGGLCLPCTAFGTMHGMPR